MAKDPAFLFYPGDASEDTQFMNRLERGCYFDLLKAQKKFRKFSLEQIKKVLGKDFEECWPALELVLFFEDGFYSIEWANDAIEKAYPKYILYCFELYDDNVSFIKVGITNNCNRRKSNYKSDGFSVNFLYLKEFDDRLTCETIETWIHNSFTEFKYIPDIAFCGSTECYIKEILQSLKFNNLWH